MRFHTKDLKHCFSNKGRDGRRRDRRIHIVAIGSLSDGSNTQQSSHYNRKAYVLSAEIQHKHKQHMQVNSRYLNEPKQNIEGPS